MRFAVILFKTSFESTELFINSFNHEDNHCPTQKHFPEGKNYGSSYHLGTNSEMFLLKLLLFFTYQL